MMFIVYTNQNAVKFLYIIRYVPLKFHSKYYHNTYCLKVIVSNGGSILLSILYQTFQLILIVLIYGKLNKNNRFMSKSSVYK